MIGGKKMPAIKLNQVCKVCGGTNRVAKEFCHSHESAFRRGTIDINGNFTKPNYYFDENFHIRKIKCDLPRTVRESPWYRKWTRAIIAKAGRKCSKCGKGNVRIAVHHSKIRFCDILNKAKELFPDDVIGQLKCCEEQHTEDIGICLCSPCHAEEHEGEKVYNALRGHAQVNCLICDAEPYCRNFCHKHYGQFRAGVYDEKGTKIRLLSYEKPKRVKLPKPPIKVTPKFCKICDEKHFGLGFCTTHYNRFRIGQIDKDGNELRPLQFEKNGPRRFITFNGQTKSFTEWAAELNIDRRQLYKRLRLWSLERALTTPVSKKNSSRLRGTDVERS
jgi:hypothetical protein